MSGLRGWWRPRSRDRWGRSSPRPSRPCAPMKEEGSNVIMLFFSLFFERNRMLLFIVFRRNVHTFCWFCKIISISGICVFFPVPFSQLELSYIYYKLLGKPNSPATRTPSWAWGSRSSIPPARCPSGTCRSQAPGWSQSRWMRGSWSPGEGGGTSKNIYIGNSSAANWFWHMFQIFNHFRWFLLIFQMLCPSLI